ncbi:MAG: pilus assembly protein [Chloroflexi bacterium]|nr:MAG: pilus assembly protein [Chloroflexota bacterium]
MSSRRGSALMEFALTWPVALLLVLGCVQLAIWATEAFAARSAALAGARAATIAGARPGIAAVVAVRALGPSLPGTAVGAWCPGQGGGAPDVRVCAKEVGVSVEVTVGGSVSSLVPILPSGLPLRAHVVLPKESFAR